MKITHHIDIRATPEEVFYWLGDPARAMEWMTSVARTEVIERTPGWIGTTFRETVEEGGRGTELRGVVTDFVANQRMAFQLEGEYNAAAVVFTLSERDGLTRVTQEADVRFKGVTRVLSILFGASFKRQILGQAQKEFARLKVLCEGGAAPHEGGG